METVSLEIKETEKELNNKLENEEREEIKTTLRNNDEINRKHLLQRKSKNFTYLEYKPTRRITETTELEHGLQFHRKTGNPGGKPTYASILYKWSNTNIQGKLSKKNIAETNTNINCQKASYKQAK